MRLLPIHYLVLLLGIDVSIYLLEAIGVPRPHAVQWVAEVFKKRPAISSVADPESAAALPTIRVVSHASSTTLATLRGLVDDCAWRRSLDHQAAASKQIKSGQVLQQPTNLCTGLIHSAFIFCTLTLSLPRTLLSLCLGSNGPSHQTHLRSSTLSTIMKIYRYPHR